MPASSLLMVFRHAGHFSLSGMSPALLCLGTCLTLLFSVEGEIPLTPNSQTVYSFLLWSLVSKEIKSWGSLFPHPPFKSHPSHLLHSLSVPCPHSLWYLFEQLQRYCQWLCSWLICTLEEGRRAGLCLSCSSMCPWYLGDASCSWLSRWLDE